MNFSGQYLTYANYKLLGGTLEEMPFNLLEFEARQNIDKYTFGRLKDLKEQTEDTKMCVYKLINMISSYNDYETHSKAISRENIDGYSISYNAPNNTVIQAKNSEIKDIIRTYLVDCKLEDKTPYMYCGADK